MTDANKVMASGLQRRSMLDELVRLHAEGMTDTGEPPDFLLVPWDRVSELEQEMDAVCTVSTGPQSPYSFVGRMIRGEVQCNRVPVHPGKCFGWGYARG